MTSAATAPGGGVIAHVRPPPTPVVPAPPVVPAVPVVPPRPALPVVPPVVPAVPVVPAPPVVPAVPVVPPRPPAPIAPAPPVVPPVPAVVAQVPYVQVDEQGRLQPPQWVKLVLVSTQVEPQTICPCTGQLHDPLVHVAPVGQTLLQVPQLSAFVLVSTHAPAEHCICPVAQAPAHALLVQTCVPGQVVVQLPQWVLSDETHMPPHSMPEVQTQLPAWHICPAPQVLLHAPQFVLSLPITLMHACPQAVWPVAHIVPVAASGFAQLATNRAQQKITPRAGRKVCRPSMFKTPSLRGLRGGKGPSYSSGVGRSPDFAEPGIF